MITKKQLYQLIDNLSEDDLRLVYTFIQEYLIAEGNEQYDEYPNKDT